MKNMDTLNEFIDKIKRVAVTESVLDPKDGSYMSLLCEERKNECLNLVELLEELKRYRLKDECNKPVMAKDVSDADIEKMKQLITKNVCVSVYPKEEGCTNICQECSQSCVKDDAVVYERMGDAVMLFIAQCGMMADKNWTQSQSQQLKWLMGAVLTGKEYAEYALENKNDID